MYLFGMMQMRRLSMLSNAIDFELNALAFDAYSWMRTDDWR